MRPPVPESAILSACLDWLTYNHVTAWRVNTGAMKQESATGSRFIRFNPKGTSDILAVIPPTGRLAAIEVKRADGKTTAHQDAFLDRIRSAGGIGIVVRSVDDLEAAIKPLLRRTA